MNKTELLAYLLAKPQIIALENEQACETVGSLQRYTISAIVELAPDTRTVQSIGYYEDIGTKQAFFMNREPFPEPTETFLTKVMNKIAELITAGTIKAGLPDVGNEIHRRMICTVIMPNNSKHEVLVFEKPDGTLDYVEIG